MKLLLTTSLLILLLFSFRVNAQNKVSGKVLDSETREPLIGANIIISGTSQGTVSDYNGAFEMPLPAEALALEISYVGYVKQVVDISASPIIIALNPSVNSLEQVVVTANREAALRTEAPIAISKLSIATINETKPVLLTELINKVPGVAMLNYNNEQHGMSIRQPMSLSSYFLYLEDGVPIRPMGVFNHNALIEMNLLGISGIEVIKGPASSLFGPEAVGGAINFISHRPTAVPTAKIGVQADHWGYKRFQYGGGGMITPKIGFYISGFEARQRDAWQAFSDYDKSSINARIDYSLSSRTNLTLSFSANEYNSDMTGSPDSISFYSRNYKSTTDFTFREVHSQRTKLSVSHQWNENNRTEVTFFYRDNYIKQNPNYSIRWTQGSNTATGELNYNGFFSRGVMFQHSKQFKFLQAGWLAGGMVDNSPNQYNSISTDLEAVLRADGKSVEKYIQIQERPDKKIAEYNAELNNTALYSQFEFNPTEKLKLTLGLRYDKMSFDYVNKIDASSGTKFYEQVTPKAGATYDIGKGLGAYANYSQGFSPPALTAIFRKRTAQNGEPSFYYNLEPAKFNNYEIGGWASLFENKFYVDVALYQMNGEQELISIRQPDNSFDYQSAGKTLHRGIEYSFTYKPSEQWFIRFGGTNAVHRFEDFKLSSRSSDAVQNVDGNIMPQSPSLIANSEVTYRPTFVKGLRLSLEWQRISSWYQNQVNTVKYEDRTLFGLKGISYLNLRAGYTWKGIEIFTNVMNLTDELYANGVTRGNGATDKATFTAAAPRTIVAGIQYNIFHNRVK